MKQVLIFLSAFICLLAAHAEIKPLPVEQAFIFSAKMADNQSILVKWRIAPKYFLYRERISFQLQNSQPAELGQPILLAGILKHDPHIGAYQIYQNEIVIPIPILTLNKQIITLLAHYQGCSAEGFCYPPMTQLVTLDTSKLNYSVPGQLQTAPSIIQPKILAEQDQVTQLLKNHQLWFIMLGFFGFGLLLSFTPCVLPMIPILSGIIVGQRQPINTYKAFLLSLTYVLSMAITYAIAGILIGFIGGSIQSVMQKPWIIILFSLLFIILALSLFGFYQLKLPALLEERIAKLSNRQKHGSYIGTAIMGCLATLIVSPCVTPALVGALSYISQTGNALVGGVALFTMALGMGMPLLLIGTAGGKLLPKTGSWMVIIERICGVLLIAVAIWMSARILPGTISMLLWACLFIICAIYMGIFSNTSIQGWFKLWKAIGFILFIYGILILIGAAMGNNNPLQPLTHPIAKTDSKSLLNFKNVQTIEEVQQALLQAKKQHKPVLLDYYADWCIACKEMDTTIFANPQIIQLLKNFILLRSDVTANDQEDQKLLQTYQVIAPPTFIFFNRQGQWLTDSTVVGLTSADNFIKYLQHALKQS